MSNPLNYDEESVTPFFSGSDNINYGSSGECTECTPADLNLSKLIILNPYLTDPNITNSLYNLNGQLYFNGNTVDKTYYHDQAMPSALWTITHNLKKKPSVTVFDSTNKEVQGGYVEHIDNDSLTIEFGAPFSGKAQLN